MVGCWWVGGQAVGSKGATLLEEWVWVSGKGRLGAGYLIHGRKNAPELEGKHCNISGRERIGVSLGQCFIRMWNSKHRVNASGSSHLLGTQSLFNTQPHPKPAPLQGWCPKFLPGCALCEGFKGKHELRFRVPRDPTLSWELLGKHWFEIRYGLHRTLHKIIRLNWDFLKRH